IDIGRSLASMTTLTSQPRATRESSVSTKSPFFDLMTAPVSVPVRSSRSPVPRARSASIVSRRSSKAPPFAVDRARPAPRAAGAASRARGAGDESPVLARGEPLFERLEALGHLLAELVHRGVEPGRVEQDRELG